MPRLTKKKRRQMFTDHEKEIVICFLAESLMRAENGCNVAAQMVAIDPENPHSLGVQRYWQSIERALRWIAQGVEQHHPWIDDIRRKYGPKKETPCQRRT